MGCSQRINVIVPPSYSSLRTKAVNFILTVLMGGGNHQHCLQRIRRSRMYLLQAGATQASWAKNL